MRKHLPNLALLCGTLFVLWLIAEAGYLAIRYGKFGTIDGNSEIGGES